MLFNSYIFIFVFLPVCLAGYFLINRTGKYRVSLAWLCVMSLIFYGYFNIAYLPVITGSIMLNYLISRFIAAYRGKSSRRIIFVAAVLFNVLVLFIFKYYDFFIQNVNTVFKTDIAVLRLVLPLGISFFTFQQLSFVIDTYKNNAPDYPFLSYAAYILFFPQLIAGPICLHSELVPQFNDICKKHFDFGYFSRGLLAFCFGLAKKVLLADAFGLLADYGFAVIPSLNGVSALVTMLAYTFQIYFDFSGYCDMALGLSLMFNIEQPINFKSPYRALTIRDFWERWHITLTRFFTEYVYIPLGGNRKGSARTYINVFAVFLISGIWHGANYTFILWGIAHGLCSVLTRRFSGFFGKLPKAVSWLATFLFVNLAWVMFRADSVADALLFYERLFNFRLLGLTTDMTLAFRNYFLIDKLGAVFPFLASEGLFSILFLSVFFVFALTACLKMKNTAERVASFRPSLGTAIAVCLLLVCSVLFFSGMSAFLYWNF